MRLFAISAILALAASGLAAAAPMPSPYDKADLANGATQFKKCATCHTLKKGGANLIGPNLYTVFGRKAGSVSGYTYSAAMKAYGKTWSYDTLNVYLAAPMATVKGTKMSFIGLKKDKDRQDLIAYLRAETLK
jgi:cytochrome c